MTKMQKWAWGYAAMFFTVVILGYIPGFTTSDGLLFGLFKIHLIDDALHLFSGTWASWAAWKSKAASIFYFKWFGLYYTTDAFVGFFTGYTILDLVMFNFDANADFMFSNFVHNLAVNLPHFILGPLALFVGYVLSRRFEAEEKVRG